MNIECANGCDRKKIRAVLVGQPLMFTMSVLVDGIYGVGVTSGAAPDQVNTRSTLAAPPEV